MYNYVITLHTVPTPTVTISPSGPIQGAMVGSPQVINCRVSTVNGVESSSVMINWMGPGGVITTTNGRVSIGSVTDDGNNMYTKSLQFTYLMEGDEDTYTCNVMILDTSGSQSVELQSLTSELSYLSQLPNLLITCMYMHMAKGLIKALRCTVSTSTYVFIYVYYQF